MKKPIRIFFSYKHIDAPWGGANNFNRALYKQILADGNFKVVESIDQPADIMFMNQLGKGRGYNGSKSYYTGQDLKAWRRLNPKGKIVIRAINLRRHSHPAKKISGKIKNYFDDRKAVSALNSSDFCIFQSNYQKDFFNKAGYKSTNYIVVHNGASDEFSQERSVPGLCDSLILISSSMAHRKTKRHDLISKLSLIEDVKIYHAGIWPRKLPINNVELIGTCTHSELKEKMRNAHYFLHPAQFDPCPNSLIEALRFGLPVIYHPGPGSSGELVQGYGIDIDENSLETTIEQAREQYASISAELMREREQFSIENAAKAYMSVFTNIADR